MAQATRLPPSVFNDARALLLADLIRARQCRTVPVADPGGFGATVTVPGGTIWQVQSVTFNLATTAAVANRFPTMTVADGNKTLVAVPGNVAQAASLTLRHSFLDGIGDEQSDGTSMVCYPMSFGDYPIPPGGTVQFGVTNGQVGDLLTGLTLLVRELSAWHIEFIAGYEVEQLMDQEEYPGEGKYAG